MSPSIISFYNTKGGVGKTTLVTHLAKKAVLEGKNVLIIDASTQLDATNFFLGMPAFDRLYTEMLQDEGRLPAQAPSHVKNFLDLMRLSDPRRGYLHQLQQYEEIGLSIPLKHKGSLRIIPFHPMMEVITPKLHDEKANHQHRDMVLRPHIAIEFAAEKYNIDLILIDLDPSTSIMNQILLLSSTFLVVPSTPDAMAAYSIKTLGLYLSTWKEQFNAYRSTPTPIVAAFVFNAFNFHEVSYRSLFGGTHRMSVDHMRPFMALRDAHCQLMDDYTRLSPSEQPTKGFFIPRSTETYAKLSPLRLTAFDSEDKKDEDLRMAHESLYHFIISL